MGGERVGSEWGQMEVGGEWVGERVGEGGADGGGWRVGGEWVGRG